MHIKWNLYYLVSIRCRQGLPETYCLNMRMSWPQPKIMRPKCPTQTSPLGYRATLPTPNKLQTWSTCRSCNTLPICINRLSIYMMYIHFYDEIRNFCNVLAIRLTNKNTYLHSLRTKLIYTDVNRRVILKPRFAVI